MLCFACGPCTFVLHFEFCRRRQCSSCSDGIRRRHRRSVTQRQHSKQASRIGAQTIQQRVTSESPSPSPSPACSATHFLSCLDLSAVSHHRRHLLARMQANLFRAIDSLAAASAAASATLDVATADPCTIGTTTAATTDQVEHCSMNKCQASSLDAEPNRRIARLFLRRLQSRRDAVSRLRPPVQQTSRFLLNCCQAQHRLLHNSLGLQLASSARDCLALLLGAIEH